LFDSAHDSFDMLLGDDASLYIRQGASHAEVIGLGDFGKIVKDLAARRQCRNRCAGLALGIRSMGFLGILDELNGALCKVADTSGRGVRSKHNGSLTYVQCSFSYFAAKLVMVVHPSEKRV